MPGRKSRAGDRSERSVRIRPARRTSSIDRSAIQRQRSIRIRRIEMVQSIKRLEAELKDLMFAPHMELLEQIEIHVFYARTIGYRRLLIADTQRVHRRQ